MLGLGYQGRRGSDTLPLTGSNFDPVTCPQSRLITPSARGGSNGKRARSSRARPCRCQCGTATSSLCDPLAFLRRICRIATVPHGSLATQAWENAAWRLRFNDLDTGPIGVGDTPNDAQLEQCSPDCHGGPHGAQARILLYRVEGAVGHRHGRARRP